MSRFHSDDVGHLCKTDPLIVLVVSILFLRNKDKVDKTMEIKRSTMSEMRLLGKLLIAFDEEDASLKGEDMFLWRNFAKLEGAIERVTISEHSSSLKHGLKNGLYYLLENSTIILMSSYVGKDNDEKAAEIQHFVHFLELNHDAVFTDTVYAINKSRKERLRMPEQMANNHNVQQLNLYTEKQIRVQVCQNAPCYKCERKGNCEICRCSGCKGFYSKKQFHRHK